MTTVLVVDDAAVDRRLVGGLLEKDGGWKTEYANNGSEALARMKETVPDLVITDLQMPDMDGLELVAATRVHYPHVPVILITVTAVKCSPSRRWSEGRRATFPKRNWPISSRAP